MIRFKTIDPADAQKPVAKAQPVNAAPQPAVEIEPEMPTPVPDRDKPKGLTRKTPLRAKKAQPAKLFDE